MRALLIVQDSDIRKEVEATLRSRQCDVLVGREQRIAWKSLRKQPPDLVVLQVPFRAASSTPSRAAEKKGIKLLARLAEATQAGHSHILALVDAEEPAQLEEVLAAGADDLLPLPLAPAALTSRLLVLERRVSAVNPAPLAGSTAGAASGSLQGGGEEQALRQSEKLYRTLVESARDILFTLSPDGNITSINPAFEALTGWPRQHWLGKHFSPLIHREDSSRTMRALRAAVRGETPSMLELRVQSKSGDHLVGEFLLTPQVHRGKVVGMLGACRDITDRKRAQSALEESESRYRDLVEHTRALLCIHDLDGRILFMSRGIEATLGYNRKTLLNRNLRDLLPSRLADLDRYTSEIRDQGFVRGLMTAQAKSGETRTLEYRSTLRSEGVDDPVVRTLAVDITEQRRAQRALRDSEKRHRTLFEGVPVGLYRSLPTGEILNANQALVEMLGFPDRESLLATNAGVFYIDAEDRTRWLEGIEKRGMIRDVEVRLRCLDGSIIWVRAAARVVRGSNGKILYYEGTVQDITQHKRAEEALRESEERFRSLVQNSNDMLVILDADSTVLYQSPAIERILGYPPGAWNGTSQFEYVHAEDLVRVGEAYRTISKKAGQSVTLELRLRHQDGSWCFVEATCTNLLQHPAVKGLVVNSRDITERKQAEEQLIHDALHDTLTGLPNRALLLDRLERVTRLSLREPQRLFAILFLDLDRFKLVNDSLGHRIGDLLLIEISKALEQVMRPTDTIARLGGDEFVILLEDVQSSSDPLRVAERIHYRLQTPFFIQGHEIFTTVSIGIALSRPGDPPEHLLRDADTAMYRAKAQGKACHVVFDDAMHQLAIKRLDLETELRRALEHQDFRLRYQPITCLHSGDLIGFECLVRWQHAERGLVLPGEFLAAMEETGLIIPLGRYVLQEACRQLCAWQASRPASKPPLIMSVNLSNKQFFHPRLLDELREILSETGLDPSSLALEITEGVLVEHTDWAARRFSKLKDMKVRLYLDDFGKGYSSLSYLHGFPVDMLKIDRSFVDHLDQNGENEEIVHAIVTLGHNLGLKVVAEGVETAVQAQASKKLACDYGQGFFFSEPVDAEQAERMVTNGS